MRATNLLKVLKAVRNELDDDCSVQKVLILMAVAESGAAGIDQQTLQERTLVGRSNCSKIIADLTHLTYRKAPGPALVRSDADPMNMRIRIIRLTPKGEKAVAAILGEG